MIPTGLLRLDSVERRVERNDLRIDRQLTQASSDQLRVLRAKIEDENSLVGHERRYYHHKE
jgi:hypothetical protein